MIARNFRRFPEAMALQLVLTFGRCMWHTGRPTTRLGRALRAERSRMAQERPQIVRWVKVGVPAWWRAQKRAARDLAASVKAAMLTLVWDQDTDDNPEDQIGEIAKLFAQADQFEEQHEDSFRWMHMTAMVRTDRRRAVWEHYGVGCGCTIPDDYRR